MQKPEQKCNLCGSSTFMNVNTRPHIKCTGCGSLERTRLMKFYLDRLQITPHTRVLHLAPERGLYTHLKSQLRPENYVTADFDPTGFPFVEECVHIDLCELDAWETGAFDLILHSHVLEHTPCNISYTLFHLDRMLAADGCQICVIPFMPGMWDEQLSGCSDQQRIERFGQNDHVRKFGCDDRHATLGRIVQLPDLFDAEAEFGARALDYANIPANQRRGFHGSTVLEIKKGSYLLR